MTLKPDCASKNSFLEANERCLIRGDGLAATISARGAPILAILVGWYPWSGRLPLTPMPPWDQGFCQC